MVSFSIDPWPPAFYQVSNVGFPQRTALFPMLVFMHEGIKLSRLQNWMKRGNLPLTGLRGEGFGPCHRPFDRCRLVSRRRFVPIQRGTPFLNEPAAVRLEDESSETWGSA